jgi:hypothetical protein
LSQSAPTSKARLPWVIHPTLMAPSALITLSSCSTTATVSTINPARCFSNPVHSYEGVDLITTDLLMAMQPGAQIVLVQNFMNQPVSLEGIRYWDDPVISVGTHNIRNPGASVGPPPAPPMPEWMRVLRVAEHRRDSLEKAARAEARERDRHANVVSTPAPHPPNNPPHLAPPGLRFQRHH